MELSARARIGTSYGPKLPAKLLDYKALTLNTSVQEIWPIILRYSYSGDPKRPCGKLLPISQIVAGNRAVAVAGTHNLHGADVSGRANVVAREPVTQRASHWFDQ